MKSYIKPLLFFILINFSSKMMGQLDNTTGIKKDGKTKAIVLNNSKEVKRPKSIEPNSENGFKNAYEKEKKELQKKQAEENLKNKGIINQAKLKEQQFQKAFQKASGQYFYPKIDQDLGSFRTSAKSINIICRDFQYPDGDRVTILVNDATVVPNITLHQNYQRFSIPLSVGINKIAFKALNQGSSGPNTAAFKVYSDTGVLLSSNEWNLATGAKATLIIAKDK